MQHDRRLILPDRGGANLKDIASVMRTLNTSPEAPPVFQILYVFKVQANRRIFFSLCSFFSYLGS